MKKSIQYVLLLAMSLTFVSCKKNPTTSSTPTEFDLEKQANNAIAEGVYYKGNKVENVTPEQIQNEDVKMVEKVDNQYQLTDYAWGYSVTLPEGLAYDFSKAEHSITASNSQFSFRISKETPFYYDFNFSLDDLFSFYDSESYLKENKMEDVTSSITVQTAYNYRIKAIKRKRSAGLTGIELADQYYVYIYLFQEMQYEAPMYGMLFKTFDAKYLKDIEKVITSFEGFRTCSNAPTNNVNFEPAVEDYWSPATKELYRRITNLDKVAWGMFSPKSDYNYRVVDQIEEAIDYHFPVMMTYRNVVNGSNNFQIATEVCNNIKKAWNERQQITVLTLHMTLGANAPGKGRNGTFEILDGQYDYQMKEWARAIKNMEIPVLIRFSNEMNADWTTYSGPMLMSDPEAYIALYRKLYDTFKENGVNNTLWIFNPYNRQYPIYNWNEQLTYFPGNGYVQFMGLTGYNRGITTVEGGWSSFEDLYTPLSEEYERYYSKFSWVIGEFGCSSGAGTGEDKAAWITEMFQKMSTIIPKVKIAIWFNYADYASGDFEDVCTTYFWLNDYPECLAAFKQGLIDTNTVSLISVIENFEEFLQ